MKGLTAGGVLLTGAGAAAAWWSYRRRRPQGEARLVVTVNRPVAEVRVDGRLPDPLERLGESVTLDVRPAPGGRGTEIEARLADATPAGPVARLAGADPRQPVRRALREAKSLLETGEVVRPDEPSTSRPTPLGRALDVVTRRAAGEGRL
jgi:hypothetical protein